MQKGEIISNIILVLESIQERKGRREYKNVEKKRRKKEEREEGRGKTGRRAENLVASVFLSG